MSAIDTAHFIPSNGPRHSFASRLIGFWQALRERREEKRVLGQLSRHEPRLLRDMGFSPDAIREARDSAWDAIDGQPHLWPNR